MKLLNVVILGQVCHGATVRDRQRDLRSRRSILSCSHDRDHFEPADGQKSIQSTNFMNFNNLDKEDRYCRWTLQTKKGTRIISSTENGELSISNYAFRPRTKNSEFTHVLDSVLKVST